MIKSASFKDESFIVLTLDENTLKPIFKIQQNIAEYYNIHNGYKYSDLHITLNRIKRKSKMRALEIIKELTKNYKPFEITVSNFKCYETKYNFLVLKVYKTEPLLNLANNLHNKLWEERITTIENYNEWEFHITLISDLFIQSPVLDVDFKQICSVLEGIPYKTNVMTKDIEIWESSC